MPHKKILWIVSILTLYARFTESCEEGQLCYCVRQMLGIAKAKITAPAQQNPASDDKGQNQPKPQGKKTPDTTTKPGQNQAAHPNHAKDSNNAKDANLAKPTPPPQKDATTLAPKISVEEFEASCPKVEIKNLFSLNVYKLLDEKKHTLACSVYNVLKMQNFISPDQGKTNVLLNGLKLEDVIAGLQFLRSKYNNKGDFHRASHASDVVYTLLFFVTVLLKLNVIELFKIEVLGLIFAAAGINAGHPGFSNAYVKSKATTDFKAWALKPDGSSPLESPNQAHAKTLMLEILAETNANSLIRSLDKTDRDIVRKIIEETIMATDYPPESGTQLIDKFTALVTKFKKAGHDGISLITSSDDKMLVFKVLLIISDNSYHFKDTPLYVLIADKKLTEYEKETNRVDDLKVSEIEIFHEKGFNDIGPLLKEWEKLLIKAAGSDHETKNFVRQFLENYRLLDPSNKPQGFTK